MCWPLDKIDLRNEKAEAEFVARRLKSLCGNSLPHDFLHDLKSIFKAYFSKHKLSKRNSVHVKALRNLAKNKKYLCGEVR